MQLDNMPAIKTRGKKRLGQGHGSGRGKTSGRGTKGQKARNKVPLYFEGGALPLIKRLPMRRGKGKNKSFSKKPIIVNLEFLNLLKKNDTVSLESLVEKNIISEKDAKEYGVKILGRGKLDVSLNVNIPTSKSAQKKIEKAGGKVIFYK